MKVYDLFKHDKQNAAKWILGVSVFLLLVALLDASIPQVPGGYLIAAAIIFLLLVIIRMLKEVLKLPEHTTHLYEQTEAMIHLSARLPKEIIAGMPPLRDYAASPDFLRVLLDEVERVRPQVVVEASSGVSTYLLAYALSTYPGEKQHYALEHEAFYADISRSRLPDDSTSQVLHAPLVQHQIEGQTWSWYSLDAIQTVSDIDMLVIDGPPFHLQAMARFPAIPLLIDRLKSGAVIILDDAARGDEQRIVAEWKAQYGLESRYIATEKGTAILVKP